MQRWWAVYAAIPGTGKIITLATFYMKKNNPEVSPFQKFFRHYTFNPDFQSMSHLTGQQMVEDSYPLFSSLLDDGKFGFALKKQQLNNSNF